MTMRIVGIGASAGGIEAFRLFFQAMPPDCGLGFVIVLHMAADHKSALAGIIGRWTSMPVTDAVDGDQIAPDHVYVVPAGYVCTVQKGRARLRKLAPGVPREAAPIDEFFDSLATDLGASAVGVVLSGTGHDGALGLKAIRARAGLTLAQAADGTAPEHSGMPDSAIATGAVDLIAPVQEMPALICGVHERQEDAEAEATDATSDTARLSICEILRARVGHDFSQYKSATFLRRVQRRMQVLGLDRINAYVTRLEADREEAMLLFRDLLIGVTTFFRDAGTFEALEQVVIPSLFEGKTGLDTVRIWVAGCATGEEAYSIGILVREHLDSLKIKPKVQVFATDIDDAAIATARAGRYPATLLEGVSPERRDQFFAKQGNSFVVTKELRDICTFSVHSLVRDPPFSRMNLVSCRNLLIYMDVDLQAGVVPAFHYALLPGGVLVLGSAEGVTRHEMLFAPLDKDNRIFVRREGPSPMLKILEAPKAAGAASSKQSSSVALRSDWLRTLEFANTRVLERYAAPFVIILEDGTLLHYSSHVGTVLLPALGTPSRNLFDMVQRDLRLPLRHALRLATQSGKPTEQEASLPPNGTKITIIIELLPGDRSGQYFLVVFKQEGSLEQGSPSVRTNATEEAINGEIDRELRDVREQLQSLSEEHETALEELRSSNEELLSVNVELKTTNEELEVSRQQVQSFNEELHTMNAQLSNKVEELDRANSDLRNLFESTRVATVFLDVYMVIRAFTPDVAGIYNLIPSDRGRPLTDIVSRLDYDQLREDFSHVMHTLEPVERRVSRQDGSAHYLLKFLPYRTPDSTVDGAVATFVDVTLIVEAEQHQRLMVDELNHRVKNMLTVVISLAQQTLRRSATLGEFSAVFLGRVEALTVAYTLLSRENWSVVQLREVIEDETKPFQAADIANIHIQGPPVPLDPRGALALGMAFHELATNASKYGALSVPGGTVSIQWSVGQERDDTILSLNWIEKGGPAVRQPSSVGFGTTLIERSLKHELGGTATIDFAETGVRAYIRVPVGNPNNRKRLTDTS